MNYAEMAEEFRNIADDLRKATELYPDGTLDMEEGRVKDAGSDVESPHHCGTIHCFAGWWGVMHQEVFYSAASDWDYATAAKAIARLLGFYNSRQMVFWAHENPEIWGNVHGYSVFSSPDAFGDCETLHDIIMHLQAVADRLDMQPTVEVDNESP